VRCLAAAVARTGSGQRGGLRLPRVATRLYPWRHAIGLGGPGRLAWERARDASCRRPHRERGPVAVPS